MDKFLKKVRKVWSSSNVLQALTLMAVVVAMCTSVTAVYAGGDSGLLDALDDGLPKIINAVIQTYMTSVGPLLIIITLVILALNARNDKVVAGCKEALKWEILVFVGCGCWELLKKTLQWVVTTLGGTTGGGTTGGGVQ